MWLSCAENPPPYGLRVRLSYKHSTSLLTTDYVRRRKRDHVSRYQYRDFWTLADHSPKSMEHSTTDLRVYTWEVPKELQDGYEIFEDD